MIFLQLLSMVHGLNVQSVTLNIAHLLVPTAGDPLGDVKTLVNNIETTVRDIATAAFFIGIAVGAMMRMLAFGSERRIAVSNMALTAAIVGLAIFLLSSAIQTYLTQILQ
ncbi:MAG TPA: hypothetical protein VFB12_00230 [Ktedonobacteraceae bacterium]|nr:hypothetical protein [Ktedonobacteraceae bacterium]